MLHFRILLPICLLIVGCATKKITNNLPPGKDEKHLNNIRQLTFGGDNAEAYWSFDGKQLTFQSNNPAWGLQCDQIFTAKLTQFNDSSFHANLISTGEGRTTCSYFMPDNKHILFASTHLDNKSCPPPPETKGAYAWPLYKGYDIFVSDLKGKITSQLTKDPGYDAEATVSPDGKKIVFTSTRSGDLELWIMDIDGSNQKQLTSGLGYDGGAFFSPDSKKIVFRSSRPKTEQEIKKYKELLSEDLVEPTNMEIYTMNIDGTDLKQVTSLGKANWAPFYHPGNKKIIFSSNHKSARGYDFQLYMIDEDGSNLEQITTEVYSMLFPCFRPMENNSYFRQTETMAAAGQPTCL
jgi:Tol biopolymer transport system component